MIFGKRLRIESTGKLQNSQAEIKVQRGKIYRAESWSPRGSEKSLLL